MSRKNVARLLTERETFASTLSDLVLQRCIAGNVSRTSRTGLQATVPVGERPYVRRGIDALIDLGVLSMSGEDVGFTPMGNVFLAYVSSVKDRSATLEEDVRGNTSLNGLLSGIQADPRLALPKPLEEVQTLPSRLEGMRRPARTRSLGAWILLAAIALLAGAVAFVR
jgi:hypothetical protein